LKIEISRVAELDSKFKGSLIVVTGATGYIGGYIVKHLLKSDAIVRPVVREIGDKVYLDDLTNTRQLEAPYPVGDYAGAPDWRGAVQGADAVIHVGGRIRVPSNNNTVELEEYNAINARATEDIAKASIDAGVSRFIFLSSVSVYGSNSANVKILESFPLEATDPYGLSKKRAEAALSLLSKPNSSMDIDIIRAPLVYGVKCSGNFRALARLVRTGLPLPFGALSGERSIISVRNLSAFVCCLLDSQTRSGDVYNIAENNVVTLSDLVNTLSSEMLGREIWQPAVPRGILLSCAKLLGKGQLFEKLERGIVLDTKKAEDQLGWIAPYDQQDEIKKAGLSFSGR